MAVVLRDITKLKQGRLKAGILVAIFLPLAIWYFFHFHNWWRVLTFLPLGVALFSFRFFYAYHAGLNMEGKVSQILRSLPGEVFILHDLAFPPGKNTESKDKQDKKEKEKKVKMMHLVVTARGIFNIETRHRQGKIVGEGDMWDHYWVRDHNQIESPVKRAVENSALLLETIREGAAQIFADPEEVNHLYIQPVVVFTNDTVELKVMGSKVPVFRLTEFEKYINSFRKRTDLTPEVREKLARYLLQRGTA